MAQAACSRGRTTTEILRGQENLPGETWVVEDKISFRLLFIVLGKTPVAKQVLAKSVLAGGFQNRAGMI